ncbi:MAG: DUF4333 domain-containing protein [Solirubrobacterales bacterium]
MERLGVRRRAAWSRGRRTRSRAMVGAPLLLVAGVLTACAGTVIDDKKAREAIKDDVQRKTGVEVKAVSCPRDVPVDPGRSFTCVVVAEDGRRAEVRLRIRNFDADVETISITPVRG